MGICCSSQSAKLPTAKLVLYDGRLQEYSYPATAAYALQNHPSFVICKSDEMDFDRVVSALGHDEKPEPGQLYFALPLSRLKRPMHAEEMDSLAVKASSALQKSTGGKNCCWGWKFSLPSSTAGDLMAPAARPVPVGGIEQRKSASCSGFGNGRRRLRCSPKLSAIPE